MVTLYIAQVQRLVAQERLVAGRSRNTREVLPEGLQDGQPRQIGEARQVRFRERHGGDGLERWGRRRSRGWPAARLGGVLLHRQHGPLQVR